MQNGWERMHFVFDSLQDTNVADNEIDTLLIRFAPGVLAFTSFVTYIDNIDIWEEVVLQNR